VWASGTGQYGGSYGIFGQRYSSNGNRLGTEFQANTYTNIAQEEPVVATIGDGGFVIAWQSGKGQDGSDRGVFGRRFDSAGTAVGGEFQINTYTTGRQFEPAIASDA